MSAEQLLPLSPSVDLTVIIVSYNTIQALKECLASVYRETKGLAYEVIVVDNASQDGSPEMVDATYSRVKLLRNTENVGFARGCNQGIRASQGRYILLLNSDAVILDDALSELVKFIDDHPDAGAAGPRLIGEDGQAQPYAFGRDPNLAYLVQRTLSRLLLRRYAHDWGSNIVKSVDWVSGACLIVRRAILDQVGLLDEGFFMYFEDNDWCLRMRREGWKVYFNPAVGVKHSNRPSYADVSRQQHYYESLIRFHRKHYGLLASTVLRALLKLYRPLAPTLWR